MESVGGMALPSQSPFAARNRLNAILPCRRSARRHFLSTSPVVARARLHSILPSRRPAQRMAWPPRRSWCSRGPQSLLPCRPTPPAPFPHPPRVPLLLSPTFHSTDTHLRSNSAACHISAPRHALLSSSIASTTPSSVRGSRLLLVACLPRAQPFAQAAGRRRRAPSGPPLLPTSSHHRAAPGRPSHVRSQVRRFAAAHCSLPFGRGSARHGLVARGGRCLAQSR